MITYYQKAEGISRLLGPWLMVKGLSLQLNLWRRRKDINKSSTLAIKSYLFLVLSTLEKQIISHWYKSFQQRHFHNISEILEGFLFCFDIWEGFVSLLFYFFIFYFCCRRLCLFLLFLYFLFVFVFWGVLFVKSDRCKSFNDLRKSSEIRKTVSINLREQYIFIPTWEFQKSFS